YFKSGSHIGQFEAWSVHDLARERKDGDLFLLDVRDIANVRKYGMIPEAHHIYVGELPGKVGEVPMDRKVAVYCVAGFKGSLVASYLTGKGYLRLTNVLGGMGTYLRARYPVEHVQ